MTKSSARRQTNFPGPHPLAVKLIGQAAGKDMRVLEFGTGSGRNLRALTEAGLKVTSVEPGQALPATDAFDAALSTHALLHGTPGTVQAALERIESLLKPSGLLYATLGSKRDARFGRGTRISEHVFAPADGDETGVAHAYWTESEVRVLLAGFTPLEIWEEAVDDIAGRWAHKEQPLRAAFHWMIVAQVP